jgi:hypothetical protein
VGLLALAWLELVSPTLRAGLPRLGGMALGRCFDAPALPRSLRDAVSTVFALWLGALTHVLWDGFTHRNRWPASVLYADVTFVLPGTGMTFHLSNFLQHLSTVVGLLLAVCWLRRARRGAPSAGPAHRPEHLRALAAALLLGATTLIALDPAAISHPWHLFWTSARGGLIGLTVACVALQAHRRLRFGRST